MARRPERRRCRRSSSPSTSAGAAASARPRAPAERASRRISGGSSARRPRRRRARRPRRPARPGGSEAWRTASGAWPEWRLSRRTTSRSTAARSAAAARGRGPSPPRGSGSGRRCPPSWPSRSSDSTSAAALSRSPRRRWTSPRTWTSAASWPGRRWGSSWRPCWRGARACRPPPRPAAAGGRRSTSSTAPACTRAGRCSEATTSPLPISAPASRRSGGRPSTTRGPGLANGRTP
mmetsp:Transcript_65115/g.201621  ORF Transcript_65115/g.201621 Transcript_65115/m.201621 type:complete len:235 (+) Transcript_65115:744-1448(+)